MLWAIRVCFNPIIPALSALESRMLCEIQKHVKGEYSEILKEQLNSINVVRELGTGDTEVYLCHWSPFSLHLRYMGKQFFDKTKPKEKLAHLALTDEGGKKVECTLYAQNGVISHLYLQTHTTEYKNIRGSTPINIEVLHGLITNNENKHNKANAVDADPPPIKRTSKPIKEMSNAQEQSTKENLEIQ